MDISTKAVLMSLTVKNPTGNRKDADATASVVKEFNLVGDSGAFSKRLFGDSLKPYKTAAGRVTEWFRKVTLPWGEDGIRIIPANRLLKIREEIKGHQADLKVEVEKVIDTYPDILRQARERLGQLFNEEDYPSASELREKFGLEVKFYPFPSGEDFRVDVSAAERQVLEDQLRDSLKATMDNGLKDLWRRLHDRVAKMAEILERDKGTLRDDFIARTIDLCQSLKDLNLWGDAKLAAMVAEVEKKLAGVTEANISESPQVKQTLAKDVDSIMDAMAGYMGGGSMGFIQRPAPKPQAVSRPAPAPTGGYYCKVVNGNVVTLRQ